MKPSTEIAFESDSPPALIPSFMRADKTAFIWTAGLEKLNRAQFRIPQRDEHGTLFPVANTYTVALAVKIG